MAGDEGIGTVELLRRTVADGSRLIQQEVELARQELGESLRAAIGVVVGAMVLVVGVLGFLVMAIVTIVVAVAPHWIPALAFTVLFLAVAIAAAWFAAGRARRITPLTRTRETIQEDVQWARQQLKPSDK